MQALREQAAARPGIGAVPIFAGERAARMPRRALQDAWRAAAHAEANSRPEDEQERLMTFHFHDLRHVGLTEVGDAPLAVVMARAGHKSARAAVRYQHASLARDAEVVATANLRLSSEG